MDAYQQGQHHRFLRPPPPSTADPYHHQHQPLPPQPPHPHQWYSNPAHYSPSPPPPPPPQQHHYHHAPPQHQYHHAPPHSQYPLPPPPPRPPQPPSHYPPQPYAQPPNQDWGAQNWGHHQHQGWDYQAQTNEEDWAAKARAWADANKSTQVQNPQSQSAPPPEQSHYHEQYPNSIGSQVQHQTLAAPMYQQFPVNHLPAAPPPVGSDPPPYAPEGHLRSARDGTLASDSSAVVQRQGNLPSPSVHQQEVPYSYSSVTGNNGGMLPISNSVPHEGQHNIQPPPTVPLADQPLEFAPRFNHDNPHMQSSYSYHDPVGPTREMDTVAVGPSMNNWAPHYPPIPPGLPPGPQLDPAQIVPPGPSVPPFSSFPGTSLQPTAPSAGPHFTHGVVTPVHHNTVFSGNAYGIPSLSERPKKASVPNWLKEEIKKAVITTPSLDHPKEENHSLEDEVDDRSALGRGDQEDSKSIDSSRSMEEDEEDRDYEDAARTAAINLEIKRILTEVLLKVTDDLFDEIATKVLDENNLPGEVDKNTVTKNHKPSISSSILPNPKVDAKLLVVGPSKEPGTEGIIAKSISTSPGDLLGLADYATDDDDEDDHDNEIQTLSSTNPNSDDVFQKSTSVDKHDVDANGSSSLEQPAEFNRSESNLEGEPSVADSTVSKYSSAGKSTPDDSVPSRSKDSAGVVRSEPPDDVDSVMKTSKGNNQVKETKLDKNDRHEGKKESERLRTDKDNGNHKNDEKHSRREKTDEPDSSKDRRKEQNTKHLERAHESESKKRSSHVDDKEDNKKKRERTHKGGAKEESSRKREHAKEEDDDRSRHKRSSDSSKNKKRRSSSVGRGRNSKDNSGHRDNDTSDDASNDSKRKSHSRRRNLSPSPSPVKSKRRQVSRSPHSKHSVRRHSPYSSHDTNNRVRKSRSRSRSPTRRHRYD